MRNSYTALALIDSPLQAMSLIEAVHSYKCKAKDVFLIVNANSQVADKNKDCILETFKFYNYSISEDNMIEIDLYASFKNTVINRRAIQVLIAKLRGCQFKYIFLGEVRSVAFQHITKSVKKEEIILLDDGNAVRRLPSKRRHFDLRGYIKAFAGAVLGLNLLPLSKIEYFTAFLDHQDIVGSGDTLKKNNFGVLSTIQQAQIVNKTAAKSVGIIGAPLYAAGVCNESSERRELERLISYVLAKYPKQTIIYLPHRRESMAKLEYVKSRGLAVDRRNAPVEMKLFELFPITLVGFYSSCFETIPKIYSNIDIEAVRICNASVNDGWRSFVDSQYECYRSVGQITEVNCD